MNHVVVIGNGISGITAARTVRKLNADVRITVISAETDYFFSRTALMYIYMGHMTFEDTQPYQKWFWPQNRIDLVRGYVQAIDTEARTLHLGDGQTIGYDRLVLGLGSSYNLFGWPGQDLHGVQGLISKPDLDEMERNTRGIDHAVVVGGGLIGIEMAEMLHSRHVHTTFLVREKTYMPKALPAEEGMMIVRHVKDHGIDLRMATEFEAILGDDAGRVRAVRLKDSGEEVACQFVGLTVGVHPNIDILKDTPIETGRGVMVDEHMQTSVPGVYAVGDCAQYRVPPPGRQPIEPLWYTGRMHGEVAGRHICGVPAPYTPGLFFNSAKFFDIEYQVYGPIATKPIDGIDSLYWEHENGLHAIRIDYNADDHTVRGFNLMGTRYRQNVCFEWIQNGAEMPYVLENLGQANFDPEFYKQHEKEVVAVYNRKHPNRAVTLRRRRSLFKNPFAYIARLRGEAGRTQETGDSLPAKNVDVTPGSDKPGSGSTA
ncbi:MAG: FAD-dependent oxidoreductase [Bacteroidota bacterium]